MLDKSVKYKSIIMKLAAKDIVLCDPVLPEGFRFRLYESGDGEAWAETEASVLEFDNKASALRYFEKNFLPREGYLFSRLVFIINSEGKAVANASAWDLPQGKEPSAMLHWVAVRPECQSLGLGRAVVVKTLQILSELKKGEDIFLTTQTWSWKAVKLYHSLGFNMIKSGNIRCRIKFGKKNNFRGAIRVMRDLHIDETIRSLVKNARRI